ncbi:MAG: hypothetical protein HYR85_19325 [Planctomycetes bacterium]|nr:hypothetical protein [Planctomycetota bacterium]MBI3843739.1 hypothetical protein [Planctomycetota bacterium]
MAELIYFLCMLTCLACALLLWRSHRRTRTRLLLWSSVCFGLLTIHNAILILDLVVLPATDLSLARSGSALVAVTLLAFALIWERQ